MKIVVCDDDALVYEQMKNIIASYSIVKNENLELTFYQTVEELLHAKHMQSVDEILWDRSGFYRFLKSKRNTSIFVYGRTNRDFNPQLFTKLFT